MGNYLTEAQEDVIYDFVVAAVDDSNVSVVHGFQSEIAPPEPYVAIIQAIPPVMEGNPQHTHIVGQQFSFDMRYMISISFMIYDAPGGTPIIRELQNAFKLPLKLRILQDGGFANRGTFLVDDVSAIYKSRFQRVSLMDFGLAYALDERTGLPVVEVIEVTADFPAGQTQSLGEKTIYTLDFSERINSFNIPLI